MTAYHGGKYRTKQKICDILNERLSLKKYNSYFEPFFGMGSVYSCLNLNDINKIILSDINGELINMWKDARKGILQSELEYILKKYSNDLKKIHSLVFSNDLLESIETFLSFALSWRGIRKANQDPRTNVNLLYKYIERINVIILKMDIENNVLLRKGKYDDVYGTKNLKNSLIYCDPPYESNQSNRYYTRSLKRLSFNTPSFWLWCVQMKDKGNDIFITNSSIEKVPNSVKNRIKFISVISSYENLYMVV